MYQKCNKKVIIRIKILTTNHILILNENCINSVSATEQKSK